MSRTRAARPSVTVEIAGERHVLRSDEPAEYTRAVAAHLDATIQRLQESGPVEPHRVAVLAGLFITDELFRARAELEALRAAWSASAAALARTLEHELASGDDANRSGNVAVATDPPS